MNKSVYHPRTPKFSLWNCKTEVRLAIKKDERHLDYVFQVFCTHCTGYIKEVCIIQEVPWYWYSTNESVYHIRTPKILLWKLLNGGMFGCKIGWAPLQLCLSSNCTLHMGYIKEVCIIQEWPPYWYFTNASIYHPGKPKILLWNRYTEVHLAINRDERHSNYIFQVFTHIIWDI